MEIPPPPARQVLAVPTASSALSYPASSTPTAGTIDLSCLVITVGPTVMRTPRQQPPSAPTRGQRQVTFGVSTMSIMIMMMMVGWVHLVPNGKEEEEEEMEGLFA